MPWIALAVLGGAAYQSNQARKEASRAREQAQAETARASQMATQQLQAQQEQAKIARERLNYEIGRGAEDRMRLEEQAKTMSEQLQAEQRKMAEEESRRMQAARRGGRRALLSQERLNPELGLGMYGDTALGAGTMVESWPRSRRSAQSSSACRRGSGKRSRST
jgi:chromosome segregation ATPase